MRALKFFLVSLSLIVLFFAIGCKPGGGTFENAKEMVTDTKTRIKLISIQDFAALMDKGADFKLIDCREPDEFKKGYIPGAINIPRGLLEFKIDKIIPDKSAKIYVYCLTSGRSALATESLNKLKYKDVTLINDTWEAWVKAYPKKVQK
jgi:rhodanese-related sulfurtransferase